MPRSSSPSARSTRASSPRQSSATWRRPAPARKRTAGRVPRRRARRRDEEPKIGDTVTVESFEPGQQVKVSGVGIGKGFAGTIKRHNFHRGPVSHGSHNVRAPGSIGASADPARVFKGTKMPGRMGGERVTQLGLEVVEIDAERNLLLIKGSVPGSRNASSRCAARRGGDE